jgi:hypothetical protein
MLEIHSAVRQKLYDSKPRQVQSSRRLYFVLRMHTNICLDVCDAEDLVNIKRVKCVVSGDVVYSSGIVIYMYFIVFYCVRLLVAILRIHRGAGKSLARPGRKQATATEDFDVEVSYL